MLQCVAYSYLPLRKYGRSDFGKWYSGGSNSNSCPLFSEVALLVVEISGV